ncbi:MAG: protein kinase [Solirubrobacteraceae bacterium]|nr:protein kinase [Solirubrobacteraceae bacterium]
MDDLTGEPTIASTLTGSGAVVAGRYRVRARLGRGASKEVYLAYDERLDREVALAIVVGAGSSEVARARVTREAQVTGRLGDHPNVITVYDIGEHDGVPYLVLRAMGGGSLAAALQRERLPIAGVLHVGGEIAKALAHAHAHGVVHRDVKPDNVWLDGGGGAALGDFGIAHVTGAERLTAEGVVVGTVRYLAPEQIRGERAVPASDLYALGVTLYELATGTPPFTAPDPTQVLTQHLTAAPAPPSEREPSIPPALEQLILALLDKDVARRPSADEALAALDAITDPQTGDERAAAAPRPPARRVVSVLAARSDLDDPETLHGVFERCAAVIEQHGGTVERYLGDALVGFFGLTESHGDDALRAARAAVALRSTTTELRLGIESGEVFLSAGPRGDAVATGAAITAAGRLADGAAEGEILLGESIRRAVAAEASVDPASGRLLELQAEQPALLRAATTPFVGRAHELAELQRAFSRVRDERACRLVTLAGPAGIGKSRLAGEFLSAVGDEATVLVGRCLAYGEGTTYRALADIVRGLGGDDPRRRIAELMPGDEQVARGLLGAIGLSDEPVHADETAWALRRLLERLAGERPVIVAIEDIHWAQPPLLGLLEHVVTLSGGAPILLVCLTRPELLESHPTWAAPQPNRSIVVLDALAERDARDLAMRLGAKDLSARIAQRAEGNPLFVEQLVAVDEGQDTQALPASIHAVLAARIDRLDEGERTLLQHAAVEGRTFHAGALAALLGEDARAAVGARLVALARKGLVGGDQPEHPGQDAFRFTHALIREAAYAGLPKFLRARLHADLAQWLEQQPAAADEIIGFHLEQACRLAAELGHPAAAAQDLAARAAERLAAAARVAGARGEYPAAVALLERAVALPGPQDAARLALLPALGMVLFEAGRVEDAARVLDDAVHRAPDARIRARAQVERELVRLEAEAAAGPETSIAVADAVLPVLERGGDDEGQCRAWHLRATAAAIRGRIADADAAWRVAAECAARAGNEREAQEIDGWRATAAALGPMPVRQAIGEVEAFLERVRTRPYPSALAANPLALLYAMDGRSEQSDRLLREAYATLEQLRGLCAGVSHLQAMARIADGRPELAEPPLRGDIELLGEMSGNATLATTTALLAQALWAQGRHAEADELARRTQADATPDDIDPQIAWRGVHAKMLAREDRHAEAETLAREAVGLAEQTDLLPTHAGALLDLADVLRTGGRATEADDAVRGALVLLERKGHAAGAARARALLTDSAIGA